MSKKNDTSSPDTDVSGQKNDGFNFEASLNELEKLVDALENGDLPLEQSLQDFERGINLTRACQSALTDAQQKVKILLDKNNNGDPSLEDFSS